MRWALRHSPARLLDVLDGSGEGRMHGNGWKQLRYRYCSSPGKLRSMVKHWSVPLGTLLLTIETTLICT